MESKSNKTMWITLSAAVVIVLAVVYLFMPNNGQAIEKQSTNNPAAEAASDQQNPLAPDFALQDLEGNTVRLSDYQGKVVFVNFWATWCPPCRAEIPYFVELMNEYKDDFVVLGITVDREQDIPKVPGFAEEYSINYPVLYADAQTVGAYGGITSIPTTFVVSKDGYAVGKIVGSRPKAEFERIIKSNL